MEYQIEKIRHISHEIKNQLSICDLYSEIIQKYCDKNGINDETIIKSIGSIKCAVQLAGNLLVELKCASITDIKNYQINEILSESYELSKVYGNMCPDIKIEMALSDDYAVKTDKNKLEGVIINLVKNACEAFDTENKNKKIKISTEKQDSILNIIVSNNASPIKDKEKIFEEGYTTKQSGSGMGLAICQKYMEEISGGLKLLKSDEISTDFVIQLRIE